MKLFTALDFWNFMIAVVALLIALYSVYYTRKNDKHSIEITDAYVSFVKHRPTLIIFSVLNNSNSSIKIKRVELLHANGDLINHLNYEPEQTYSTIEPLNIRVPDPPQPYEHASPFDGLEVVPPYEKLELSYYLELYRSDMKIRVTCDRPIHRFRKSKLFTPHFKKLD